MSASIEDVRVFAPRAAMPAEARFATRPNAARVAFAALAQRIVFAAAGLVLPALFVLLWWAAAARHWVPEQLLPAPALVWQTLRELWASGDLASNLEFSASRVAWSLLTGGSVGLLLGFVMGLSRTARAYLTQASTSCRSSRC